MQSPLTNGQAAEVYAVDDDADTLKLIERSLVRLNIQFNSYLEAAGILEEPVSSEVGVLLLDVRLPDIDGLHLMKRLREKGWRQPVVMITAHAEVPLAVQAMKEGAFDFIEKDFYDDSVRETVERAIEVDQQAQAARAARQGVDRRFESLTAREQQVADKLVNGDNVKRIAVDLGISPKTVEYHRANVLSKLNAESLVELTRLWLQAAS